MPSPKTPDSPWPGPDLRPASVPPVTQALPVRNARVVTTGMSWTKPSVPWGLANPAPAPGMANNPNESEHGLI